MLVLLPPPCVTGARLKFDIVFEGNDSVAEECRESNKTTESLLELN